MATKDRLLNPGQHMSAEMEGVLVLTSHGPMVLVRGIKAEDTGKGQHKNLVAIRIGEKLPGLPDLEHSMMAQPVTVHITLARREVGEGEPA